MHRVTNREQGAAVAGFPAFGEPRDELRLADRGVLEFIDQQMTDAIVERQRKVGGRALLAQCAQGTLRHLGEIHLAARLEHQRQPRDRLRQQAGNRFERLPLRVAVAGRGQRAQVEQSRAQRFARPAFLEISLRLGRALAPAAVAGQ